MLFARLALFSLPFLGALASPIQAEKRDIIQIEKRDSVLNIANSLKTSVSGPIASITAANGANMLTADNATTYLNDILNAIQTANAAIGSASAKRGLDTRQTADDLNEVGAVLAEVITDLVNALEGIADDLKSLPLIGAIIISIDGGLENLLLGVEVVLTGVVQILQGLLSGVAGLLQSLGNGLLAGLIFG